MFIRIHVQRKDLADRFSLSLSRDLPLWDSGLLPPCAQHQVLKELTKVAAGAGRQDTPIPRLTLRLLRDGVCVGKDVEHLAM